MLQWLNQSIRKMFRKSMRRCQQQKLQPAQRAQVIKLRNEGEAFHNAGQHGKAEVVLEQAKAILRVR